MPYKTARAPLSLIRLRFKNCNPQHRSAEMLPEEEGNTLLGAVSARESCMDSPAGTKRPQSVEQIALDIKVAAQERVEALAGKEALPILAEVQSCSNNVAVSTQAHSRVATLVTGNMRQ